jgi:hypothetical protein
MKNAILSGKLQSTGKFTKFTGKFLGLCPKPRKGARPLDLH